MGRGYLNVPWGLVKEGLISTNSGTSLVDVPIPLLKDAWIEADGKYTQTITMEGIKADSNPMIVLSSLEEEPTVEEMDAFACLLDETVVEDGSITFVASAIPAISFTVIARGDMQGVQAVAEVMKFVAKVDELENTSALNKQTLGYECKNLIHYPYLYKTSTSYGITWTDNGDGTITANGTTDNTKTDSYFNCRGRVSDNNPLILSKGTYVLTGCPSGGSLSGYYMQVGMTKDNGYYRLGYEFGEGCEFTLTEDTQIQVQCCVDNSSSVTVENLTFKPMVRRAEITDDTWVPYVPSVRKEIDAINSGLTPTAIQATAWNANITRNIGYKYGNLCHVYVEFNNTSAIAKNTSLFALPYKILDGESVSPPYFRCLDNNSLNESYYSNAYGLISSKVNLEANKTYVFEWVYITT